MNRLGNIMQPVNTHEPTCLQDHGRDFIALLGKSHTLDLLYFLSTQTHSARFNELKREIGITATTLSRRLEDLVVHGLVHREVYAEVPARVEYFLSEKGETLGPVLKSVFGWVEQNK